MSFKVPEEFRMTSGPLASDSKIGNNGAFAIKLKKGGRWESGWVDWLHDWMDPQPTAWRPLPAPPATETPHAE